MDYKVKLKAPIMPSFISIEESGIIKQGEEIKIPIWKLTDKEAEEYADLMKRKFLAHYKESVKRNK